MPSYTTIDSMPDLTTSEMATARKLVFSPSTSNSVGWDNTASVYGSESYAILHDIYRFEAVAGATYDIASTSYFDPFLLRVYDSQGNTMVANDEADDGSDVYLSDGYYSRDIIWDWVAPYSGTYYVSADWYQGSAHKFYALSVMEDIDTAKGPANKDLIYVFKSEKTGAGVSPASSSYFYTVSADEAAYVRSQANWPWVEKTATFEAAHSNPNDAVPVFRFWSDKTQSHFFTISAAEKAQIIDWSSTGKNGYDWKYEGENFKVYTSSTPTDALGKAAIPVYRAWMDDKDFNPANGVVGGHFFTADRAAYDAMVKLVGVTGEGVAFYGEVPGP